MPFHFWLIDTATAAPVPIVIILAGVLDSLAVYGVARVYWTVFATPLTGHHHALQAILVVLGRTQRPGRRRLSRVLPRSPPPASPSSWSPTPASCSSVSAA